MPRATPPPRAGGAPPLRGGARPAAAHAAARTPRRQVGGAGGAPRSAFQGRGGKSTRHGQQRASVPCCSRTVARASCRCVAPAPSLPTAPARHPSSPQVCRAAAPGGPGSPGPAGGHAPPVPGGTVTHAGAAHAAVSCQDLGEGAALGAADTLPCGSRAPLSPVATAAQGRPAAGAPIPSDTKCPLTTLFPLVSTCSPLPPPSYAHDELGMATMRMRLRQPGEAVAPHEAVYKVGGGEGGAQLARVLANHGGPTCGCLQALPTTCHAAKPSPHTTCCPP